MKSIDRLKELMEELAKAEDKPFHGYNKEKHSRTGGLNAEYREKYNREHGSNLKAPVTEKNPTGKQAARKKSFCARMSGVKGPTSKDGKLTPKGAALKRWRCSKCEEVSKTESQWIVRPKSEDYTHLGHTFHEVEHPNTPDGHKAYHVISPKGEKDIIFAHNVGEVGKYLDRTVKKSAMETLKDLEKRCWEGYEPVPGKKPYSKGSCQPVKKEEETPKPKPADYGLKQKPFAGETSEGKKLAAIGGKVQAIKELQEKNPHIDWKSIIKTMGLGHSMGGTTAVGGAAISKSEILEILKDLLDA